MSSIKPSIEVFKTFEDQDKFVKAALSGLYNYLLFGGDIRSGKTIVCLCVLILLSKVYPGSRWAVIRHDRPTLVRNTLPTFFKYCCPSNFIADFNKSELRISFDNRSEIIFMSESIDIDPELNRFKGLEVNGFVLEQIEELQRLTFDICAQRMGQWKLDPMPPALLLCNANPTNNWVKTDWYDVWAAGGLKAPWYFQIADITKNPYITEAYMQRLKDTLPEELYKRYLKHQWEAIDEILQLNKWEDIYGCKKKRESKDGRKYMGVDVGHDGPDPSVWMILQGGNIIYLESIGKTKIPEVERKTKQLFAEQGVNAEDTCIDAVGLGAGVCDHLEEDGYDIIKMKGGTPTTKNLTDTNFTFANHRSLSHWLARDMLIEKKVGGFAHQTLISDAGSIKYEIRDDKNIYIQSKEKFKKRTGRSSDFWDTFTYAVWAWMYEDMMPVPGIFTV